MHHTSVLTSIILGYNAPHFSTHQYYHKFIPLSRLICFKFLREHGTYNDDFRYLMFTSYTHDFKCQTLNDSSQPLQSKTYGFDHMTTNLDVNFFL